MAQSTHQFTPLPVPPNGLWCSKALGGGTVDVPSLDNRVLRVPLKEVVRPGYERLVANEGRQYLRAASLPVSPRAIVVSLPAPLLCHPVPSLHFPIPSSADAAYPGLTAPAPPSRRHAQQQDRGQGQPAAAL